MSKSKKVYEYGVQIGRSESFYPICIDAFAAVRRASRRRIKVDDKSMPITIIRRPLAEWEQYASLLRPAECLGQSGSHEMIQGNCTRCSDPIGYDD